MFILLTISLGASLNSHSNFTSHMLNLTRVKAAEAYVIGGLVACNFIEGLLTLNVVIYKEEKLFRVKSTEN